MLRRLFDPRVQEANLGHAPHDPLAFQLQDEPEHAVGAGVMRADADHHAVAFGRLDAITPRIWMLQGKLCRIKLGHRAPYLSPASLGAWNRFFSAANRASSFSRGPLRG